MPDTEPEPMPPAGAGNHPGAQASATHATGTPGRVLVALIVGQLGVHSAMAALRLAAALQVLREGASAGAVGLLLALFAAAPVFTSLHAGRLADRRGYHRPVRFAAAMSLVGGALSLASTFASGAVHFGLLCAAAFAVGAGSNTGLIVIQRAATLAARDATERVKVFSWLGVAPALSNVLGPVAVGFAIDAFGFRAAYGLVLALPLVTLAVARLVPPVPATATNHVQAGRRAWDLLATPGVKRLFVVNWLLSMCWDVHIFAVPILGHERAYSASTIGLILGTFTASVTLVRLAIPWLAHRLDGRSVVRAAMLGTGVVFALYPFAPNPWAMGLCAALLGVSLGSVQPMVMNMLHQLTPDQRHGEALALRSMAMNASSTLMPLVFGVSGAVVGAAVLFWTVGGAVAAGSALTRRLVRR